jgi:hypothetical protein
MMCFTRSFNKFRNFDFSFEESFVNSKLVSECEIGFHCVIRLTFLAIEKMRGH